MRRAIGYSLLLFWTALAAAVHLTLAGFSVSLFSGIGADSVPTLRAFVPDLVTLLLVATVGRLSRRDTLMIALVVFVGRSAFTGSPPFAVLAGTILTAYVADTLRTVAELDRPFLRIVSAGLGSLLYGYWLVFVDHALARESQALGELHFGSPDAAAVGLPIVTAVATALCALAFWPVFTRLPGQKRLERRAF
ncbi:hypothetical protein Poly30_20050 [Planctomycetes bacterium Poly30]|uniref:Uncharacterized protein n=1 Tax=Saltatorellus ferox TaxID=2528018 RepID=A0A518ER27_9BACT|nr:hypothetical protein Poly30_20050 [Planctomycetes bacterium Poly30]